jgi:hypothetical protein
MAVPIKSLLKNFVPDYMVPIAQIYTRLHDTHRLKTRLTEVTAPSVLVKKYRSSYSVNDVTYLDQMKNFWFHKMYATALSCLLNHTRNSGINCHVHF